MKKHTFSFFSLMAIMLLITVSSHAQKTDTLLTSYIKKYIQFSKEFPQEKVYLHFDNTSYYIDETIWFKAYVVRADQHVSTPMSKSLYVELVNAEGYILETKKLKLENGQCHGDFNLSNIDYGGFYEVRAYTRYMRNFSEQNYFSRVLPVYDKPAATGEYKAVINPRPFSLRIPNKRPVADNKQAVNLSFYPEGGNLVASVTSRVAFKAVGGKGENTPISGTVFNEKGEKMVAFESAFQGMGAFELTPEQGICTAKVEYQNKEYEFKLPAPLQSGYVMTVDNLDTAKINIHIRRNEKTPAQSLGLSVSCRGVLYAFQQLHPDDTANGTFSISKNTLPSGVIQITLYNAQGNVESERQIFINHHSQLKMSVLQTQQTYQPFDKIKLDFDVKDKKGHPVTTNFSVAVRDNSSSVKKPYADDMLTNLLLSSELKGYIENPSYYFEKDDISRRQALDLLMLTQGWSRYRWKQMTGIEPFKVNNPIEHSLYIEGYVTSLYKKKSKPNVAVIMKLFQPGDSVCEQGKCTTDQAGMFNFSVADFYGTKDLTLTTMENDQITENNIRLNRIFSPPLKPYAYEEQKIPAKRNGNENELYSPAIDDDSLQTGTTSQNERVRLLKEVIIKKQKKLQQENGAKRNASIIYDIDREIESLLDKGSDKPFDILDFLRRQNPYFDYETPSVFGYEGKFLKATYKGRDVVFSLNNKSLYTDVPYDDKKPLYDYEFLKSYSIDDIKSVIINEKEGAYSAPDLILTKKLKGNEVAIFIYTYPNSVGSDNNGLQRRTKFEGYSASKEFFNVPYNLITPDEDDHRRTLYWNPDVKTDENGKATVEFYNNSVCKSININAQTVTKSGAIGVLK